MTTRPESRPGWRPALGALLASLLMAGCSRLDGLQGSLFFRPGDQQLSEPELGQRLYAAAAEPKRFVLLDGGSHRNAQNAGAGQYGPVLTDLFKLRQGRP